MTKRLRVVEVTQGIYTEVHVAIADIATLTVRESVWDDRQGAVIGACVQIRRETNFRLNRHRCIMYRYMKTNRRKVV